MRWWTRLIPASFTRALYPDFGLQPGDAQAGLAYAVAVRPGDVAASVPKPQTLALLALGATVVARRRRSR